MTFQIGQKVNLWQERFDHNTRTMHIVKSVIVTITEIKTGVPGQYSRIPVSSQSLRGTDENGIVYEKHWEAWPESQTNCFTTQWSMRDDGVGEDGAPDFWVPKEATAAYSDFLRYKGKAVDRIVGPDGNDIIPQGDVVFCEKHGEYDHEGTECFGCLIDRIPERKAG